MKIMKVINEPVLYMKNVQSGVQDRWGKTEDGSNIIKNGYPGT